MSTENTCPECRAPLPSDAPAGLCPRCLIKSAAGFGSAPTVVTGGDFPDISDAADVARRLPQFEIGELLGQGGMGVVYKARQPALDRLVALKILPPGEALSPDFVERFRREARALAKLSHPNIVTVYECGESGGLYYFAMEYVDGANLRALLRERKLTPAEALAIVPRVCDALEYAHGEGVIHRDIKPENLLLDKKGRVKIADFGLAKLLRRESLDMTLTLSGAQLGTLRYMAPEQMEKPETVDHRADIYSLGVVIYEMLTGEVPMGRFAPPSERAQVDVRLDEIVLRTLERDVERRYQHASEVKTDVETVAATPGPAVSREPAVKPAPGEKHRRAWMALRGGVLLATLTGAACVAAPWQSFYKLDAGSEVYLPWFSSPGYASITGVAAGLLFLLTFIAGLVGFNSRRIAVPAVALAAALITAGLQAHFINQPPLVESPEVHDLIPKIQTARPTIETNGRADWDIIHEAVRKDFLRYSVKIGAACYVSLVCALLIAGAATLQLVFLPRSGGDAAALARDATALRTDGGKPVRSVLWAIAVLGAVLFFTFEEKFVLTGDPTIEKPVTTTTIGAIDPWFSITPGQSIRLNLATWSALAGLGALMAGSFLARMRREAGVRAIPAEAWVLACALVAFTISIAWAVSTLVSPFGDAPVPYGALVIRYGALPFAFVAAAGALILQLRHLTTPRTGWRGIVPELCVLLLGAACGAMPWGNTGFTSGTAWRFPHGTAHSLIYLAAGLVFITTGGGRPQPWRAGLTIVAGIAAFVIAMRFDNAPPPTGSPDFLIYTTHRFAGLYAAYICGIFTAIFGALQMRAALAPQKSAVAPP